MPFPSPAFSRPSTLRHSLACDLAEVRPALHALKQFLAEHSWTDDDLLYFELALAEACNNAIANTASNEAKLPLLIEAVTDAGGVEFRIHDHTPGFDWPEKISLPDDDDERGRGLFIMTRKMDHARYFRGRGENILVLKKHRTPPPGPRSPGQIIPPGPDQSLSAHVVGDLIDELSSCYESLSAIFRYGAELGKSGRTEEFAGRLLEDLLRILSADWFVLRLAGHRKLEICVSSEPVLNLPAIELESPGESLEAAAALQKQTLWFSPLPFRAGAEPLSKAKPGASGLVQPIILGGELIGTLAVGLLTGSKMTSGTPFTAAQSNIISTFAEFLAIQIANSRFQQEHLRQQLFTHELEIARNIQRSLLPKILPSLPGFTLAAFCRSAREVGGDFYDALQVDNNSVLLAIADVMGKGIPAAMFAAVLRNLLRASPELRKQPAALMARVNRLLYDDLSELDMFITAQLLFIDGASRQIAIANAGHCPLAVATGNSIRGLAPEGMPLGIKPNTVFETASAQLPKASRLLLFSDGLSEGNNADGTPFGMDRLFSWFKATTPGLPAQNICDNLICELDQYRGRHPLRDDQTFLVVASNT